jgi:hypothetical protein
MGPLGTLLSLPVGGPLSGLTWLARQIANAAVQEILDPGRIETALLLLERKLEQGEIDEATFEAEEERLLEELAEIGRLRAEGEDDDAPSSSPVTAGPATVTAGPDTVMAAPSPVRAGLGPATRDFEGPPPESRGWPAFAGHDGSTSQAFARHDDAVEATARQESPAWTPA